MHGSDHGVGILPQVRELRLRMLRFLVIFQCRYLGILRHPFRSPDVSLVAHCRASVQRRQRLGW
jgi:hypothetical protein